MGKPHIVFACATAKPEEGKAAPASPNSRIPFSRPRVFRSRLTSLSLNRNKRTGIKNANDRHAECPVLLLSLFADRTPTPFSLMQNFQQFPLKQRVMGLFSSLGRLLSPQKAPQKPLHIPEPPLPEQRHYSNLFQYIIILFTNLLRHGALWDRLMQFFMQLIEITYK